MVGPCSGSEEMCWSATTDCTPWPGAEANAAAAIPAAEHGFDTFVELVWPRGVGRRCCAGDCNLASWRRRRTRPLRRRSTQRTSRHHVHGHHAAATSQGFTCPGTVQPCRALLVAWPPVHPPHHRPHLATEVRLAWGVRPGSVTWCRQPMQYLLSRQGSALWSIFRDRAPDRVRGRPRRSRLPRLASAHLTIPR